MSKSKRAGYELEDVFDDIETQHQCISWGPNKHKQLHLPARTRVLWCEEQGVVVIDACVYVFSVGGNAPDDKKTKAVLEAIPATLEELAVQITKGVRVQYPNEQLGGYNHGQFVRRRHEVCFNREETLRLAVHESDVWRETVHELVIKLIEELHRQEVLETLKGKNPETQS